MDLVSPMTVVGAIGALAVLVAGFVISRRAVTVTSL